MNEVICSKFIVWFMGSSDRPLVINYVDNVNHLHFCKITEYLRFSEGNKGCVGPSQASRIHNPGMGHTFVYGK